MPDIHKYKIDEKLEICVIETLDNFDTLLLDNLIEKYFPSL